MLINGDYKSNTSSELHFIHCKTFRNIIISTTVNMLSKRRVLLFLRLAIKSDKALLLDVDIQKIWGTISRNVKQHGPKLRTFRL